MVRVISVIEIPIAVAAIRVRPAASSVGDTRCAAAG
jgi:hypothetical protein